MCDFELHSLEMCRKTQLPLNRHIALGSYKRKSSFLISEVSVVQLLHLAYLSSFLRSLAWSKPVPGVSRACFYYLYGMLPTSRRVSHVWTLTSILSNQNHLSAEILPDARMAKHAPRRNCERHVL